MRYEIEMDVDYQYLADVFEDHDWQWASEGVYGVPTKEDIRDKISSMIRYMDGNPDLYVMQSGRLALTRDPNFKKSYEVFLCLGYIDDGGEADLEEAVAA